MKTSLSLEHRLTHGYVQGWSHLDKHAYVCIAQHSKPRRVSGDEDGDSATKKAVVTITPLALEAAKASYRQVLKHWREQARPLTFSQFMCRSIGSALSSGCRCEYDCCGCWQYGASAVRTKRREFVATIHCYRNV